MKKTKAQLAQVNKKQLTEPEKLNASCVYDFTIFDDKTPQDLRDVLKQYSKKYTFQQESGEQTGILHYQGRMSLMIKKRKAELVKMLQPYFTKFHVSVTSTVNRDNAFYVMKQETRVSGPFSDTDTVVYIPKDVRNIVKLYPWQESLKSELLQYNDRLVDVIYDPHGNRGKTLFTRYMMIHYDCESLPFCNDYKDIMRMAHDVGQKQIYLIDMPRAISKDRLYQYFAAVESIKGGYTYDDRYKFQRRLFDPPRVCMFMNALPDLSLLSTDRWRIWTINDKLELSLMYKDQFEDEKKDNELIESIDVKSIDDNITSISSDNKLSIIDVNDDYLKPVKRKYVRKTPLNYALSFD